LTDNKEKQMAKEARIFTSESVTEGHPDKVADGIADSILDAHLAVDKRSRVACEVLCSTGLVVIAGEMTSTAKINFAQIARDKIRRIGYTEARDGFSDESCAVLVAVGTQSPDISQGVTAGQGLFKEQGAGDQGMMFGYACDETPELMPAPISFAHRLTRTLAKVRHSGKLPFIKPDGKSQVSVVYENDRPVRVDTVVISTQHSADVSYKKLRDAVMKEVIMKSIPAKLLTSKTRYFVNPTGRFVVGGPHGDSGVTGRKIIVDTYGGMGRHGGGAFSGKDPSKVDRSAAYMARYVAKNIVASGLARRCELQLAYAIGYPEPVSVLVDTFGTGKVSDARLEQIVRKIFPLKPADMIRHLNLLRPVYEATSAYGHFGRMGAELKTFTWERTDKAAAIRSAV
jgi:S-adenosylmethionine synthetase